MPLGQLFPTLAHGLSLSTVLRSTTTRGDNALRRAGARYFSDIADWRIPELRAVRNIGDSTADEIIGALAAAEVHNELLEDPRAVEDVQTSVSEIQRTWSVSRALTTLAVWATTYLGPDVTVPDAIDRAAEADDLPTEVRNALRTVQFTPVSALAVQARTITAGVALDGWVESLNDRDLALLRRRTLAAEPESFESLSAEFGVSRERVRQVEVALLARGAQLFSPSWRPLGQAVDELRAATAPIAEVDPAFDLGCQSLDSVGVSDTEVLTRLSGLAEVKDGLIAWPSVDRWLDRIDETLAEAMGATDDPAERFAAAEAALVALGIAAEAAPAWMQRRGHEVAGTTLDSAPRGSADRAYRALADSAEPLSTEQILAAMEVERTPQTVRRAMDLDDRIVRVGARHWALAAPDRRAYTGLRDAIAEALEEAGRPLPVPELLAAMRRHYVVAAHSVRVYAAREPFQTIDGVVSRAN